jgi:hypothetical protein
MGTPLVGLRVVRRTEQERTRTPLTVRALFNFFILVAGRQGIRARLLQPRVLRLPLLQDGDVGIGVFPQVEKAFVSGERPYAGGIGVT